MSAVGERNDYGLAAADRHRILTTYRTIAMVGLSSNYYNASSFAAVYLDANGYDIVPVNPAQAGRRQILGRPVYASLAEAAKDHAILMRDYHEMLQQCEQRAVKTHVEKTLADIDRRLTACEKVFAEEYGADLPPLEDAMDPDESEHQEDGDEAEGEVDVDQMTKEGEDQAEGIKALNHGIERLLGALTKERR